MINNPHRSQNRTRVIKLGSKSLIIENRAKNLGETISSDLSLSYHIQEKKLAKESIKNMPL